MNAQDWKDIVEGVLEFNRLVTTEDERKTEEYYLKCCDLLEEEYVNELQETRNNLNNSFRNKPVEEWKCSVKLLDDMCDTLVTGIQALDCVSPSQLGADYVAKYLYPEYKNCGGFKHTFLAPIIDALNEAEEWGVDIVGAMKCVNANNLSKVPLLSEVIGGCGVGFLIPCILGEECDWIEANRGYGKVTYSMDYIRYGHPRVIFRDKNLKVMKWRGYEDPKLEEFL